ncbi:peptidase M15 [Pseudoxanthomonas gei]|uniref:Peptidase M15 n=1 Tax=Pseudoxanthomonas gei TaxID=1383030 RepID=A0ABX0AEA3_9GAMM|nr:D-Ala-D-Ala carboxypeptidase family metallohydrolase [Pseudoxanthomonas gei]NDK39935.1 peptidase M15 [Pseudoxanthomonas gei]
MKRGLPRAARCPLLFSLLLVSGPQLAADDGFRQWATPRSAMVTEYQQFLDRRQLGHVAPMRFLLRSARMWRDCGASEFALAPKVQWTNIVPTLRVVSALQAAGMVDAKRVASGYRDGALNRCAGGSARSRHVLNNALDFDLAASPDNVARLCHYWRSKGPALKLGLGFYTNTRIHLDTSGFRTWGADHTHKTSLCNQSS